MVGRLSNVAPRQECVSHTMTQPNPTLLALQRLMSQNIEDRRPEGGGDPTRQTLARWNRIDAIRDQIARVEMGKPYMFIPPDSPPREPRPDLGPRTGPNDLRRQIGVDEIDRQTLQEYFKNMDAFGQPRTDDPELELEEYLDPP